MTDTKRTAMRTPTVRMVLTLAMVLSLAGALGLPSPATSSAGADGWHVIAYEGAILQADHDALAASGATAIQYLPRDSYVAWLPAGAADALAEAGRVASVRPLAASEKIDPAAGDPSSGLDPDLLSVVVYGPALGAALPALRGLGDIARVGLAQPGGALREIVLVAAADRAAAVGAADRAAATGAAERAAALPAVLYVGPASPGLSPEDEGTSQILAGNFTGNAPQPGYEAWLAARGIDGSGVRVSIVDTGVDDLHPDLAGRVVDTVDYTIAGEPRDVGGHGTHVAGIVGGNAAALREAGGVQDPAGLYYGMGMAPAVEMINQNAIATTRSSGWPPSYGFDRISRDAVTRGAIAWNASWTSGEGTNVGYINTARTMDIITRDADWQTPGSEPFQLVFSAGNSGPGASTLTSPKEAKNVITVASSRSQRAGSISTISSFSSRGPARDGRIVPIVAAPGETVASARALPAASSCNTGIPTDSFGLYATCSGTSMAAPHVTGAVALIADWWRDGNDGATPSPAMNKALLVNTAIDMGTANVPNRDEGWGRVSTGAIFDPGASRIYADQSVVFTDPGDLHELRVVAADPAQPLEVTIAWSDAPGAAGANPALVNDLDLEVIAEDEASFFGNYFVGGTSFPGGFADRLNNHENVSIASPGEGTYTIRISAANLPGDGIPFSGDATDQDFALVISNAVAAA